MPEILLVDDELSARTAIERILSDAGFTIRCAADGRAALDLVRARVPDVVVTDLVMPNVDGLGVVAELRARSIDVPVVLLTALDEAGSAVSAMRAGATDYLTKPVDAEVLLHAIERALETRALVREAAALRQRNEELVAEAERNLRAREELLAIAAHDLRGPLSTILAATSPAFSFEGKREIVGRAARRMLRLVEDLLDVARIEMGTFVIELLDHRASSLLEEMTAAVMPLAIQRGVRLETTIAKDFVVRCAFDRVVQVLVNLASNAIGVTPAGRRVTVSVERRRDAAWFDVRDEGPGIEPSAVSHVFERGWHGAEGGLSGAGLGLTIAKGIVEAHGGTIDVDSEHGAGSSFHFEIPLHAANRSSWHVGPAA